MLTCDDCGLAYAGPAYYTFDPEGCGHDMGPTGGGRYIWMPHGDCTGNLCPACAGPYIEPDHENDPRRVGVNYEVIT
jgi:hypothetical protein